MSYKKKIILAERLAILRGLEVQEENQSSSTYQGLFWHASCDGKLHPSRPDFHPSRRVFPPQKAPSPKFGLLRGDSWTRNLSCL